MWASDPWANSSYCWVVICKNAKAHNSENMMFGHKIPLAETDSFESLPVSGPFVLQCDECGQEHSYEPPDVVSFEFRASQRLHNSPAIPISTPENFSLLSDLHQIRRLFPLITHSAPVRKEVSNWPLLVCTCPRPNIHTK